MFGIGMPEMILICALALVVVGPDKLPDFARSIAKTVMDLKKTAEGLKDSFTEELSPALDDIKPELENATKALTESVQSQNEIMNSTPEKIEPSENKSIDDEIQGNAHQEKKDASPKMSTEELIQRAKSIKDNSMENGDA